MISVTKDGEKCSLFADCLALLEAGTDIDYDGAAGPLDFVDAGEPARVRTTPGPSTPTARSTVIEESIPVGGDA